MQETTTYYAIDDQGVNMDETLIITQAVQPSNLKRVVNFFGNTSVSDLETPLLAQDNQDEKKPR